MANKFVVFQSDFGTLDAAISSMEGVAFEVDPTLNIRHITHEITPYNIFEGSYRLFQTVFYWPEGTTFVSVVDPGVGSNRKSVVALTKDGHYVVTPNNGTLTHISKFIGIKEIREIEESVNRRKNTELSYTFHGRDVYAYTAARLASGTITFEEVGPKLDLSEVVELDIYKTVINEDEVIGQIDILDSRFGSLWTSITYEEFKSLGFEFGDMIDVHIYNGKTEVYKNTVLYGATFSYVNVGLPIIYMNSVYRMALAINQGNFAKAYNVGVGNNWIIKFKKVK